MTRVLTIDDTEIFNVPGEWGGVPGVLTITHYSHDGVWVADWWGDGNSEVGVAKGFTAQEVLDTVTATAPVRWT